MKKNMILLLLSVLFLNSCLSQPTLIFHTNHENIPVTVEIARTTQQHQRGLMNRGALPHNHGMLFIFTDEQPRTFWMKNTRIPLDLIFVSKNKTVIDIKQNFQPCITDICETYTSPAAHYVIEVNAGFVKQNGIDHETTVTTNTY